MGLVDKRRPPRFCANSIQGIMPRMPNPLGSRWFRVVTPRPTLPLARTLAESRFWGKVWGETRRAQAAAWLSCARSGHGFRLPGRHPLAARARGDQRRTLSDPGGNRAPAAGDAGL